MREKKFCVKCGQKLFVSLFGQIQGYEFEEGFYCEGCGKEKVKAARR